MVQYTKATLVDWPYSSPAVYCEELTCCRVSNVLDEYRSFTNLKRGYKTQNQVESCGFKIDFVISNVANGKRIALVNVTALTILKTRLTKHMTFILKTTKSASMFLKPPGGGFIV